MTEDKFLTALSAILNHYDEFQRIALDLEWQEVQDSYILIGQGQGENASFYLCSFPNNYLEEHMSEAFVQAVLANLASFNEWEKDFWIMPRSERMQCLTVPGDLYSYETKVEKVLMEPLSPSDYLKRVKEEIHWLKFDLEDHPKFMEVIHNGKSFFIGENTDDYFPQERYISVSSNSLLLINCWFGD